MSNVYPPPPGQPGQPGQFGQSGQFGHPGAYGDAKAQAKAAKAYAKAQRPWFKKKRFAVPLAIVLIAAISSAAGGGGDEEPTKAADTSASAGDDAAPAEEAVAKEPAAKPAKPAKPKKSVDVTTDAASMIKEFEDNELSADAKYKGKVIKVTGVVSKIDTEVFDDKDYVLKLNGGGDLEFLTVDCFDIPNKDLAGLQTGQKVSMIGDFKDGGDLGVELNHCKLG